MSKDFLFEIGTEDIPPEYLPVVAENLQSRLTEGLAEESLDHGEVKLFHTPRRVALLIRHLEEEQPDRTESVRGPAAHIGLDEDGEYTQAAVGFAGSHKADPDQLYTVEDGDGTYLYLDKKIPGKDAAQVLKDLLPRTVATLNQPETMRWDDSDLEFVRPIRWLVGLFGEKTIQFSIGDTTSGNRTKGHRFVSSDEISLSSPEEYEPRLESEFVIADPAERQRKVRGQLAAISDEVEGEVASSDQFIEKISNSLEHPASFHGKFGDEFLELPSVLLFKTLEGEARLIPLKDRDVGEPIPHFVGFRDGNADNLGSIKQGYESVINARLRDSKFFFEHDTKKSFDRYVKELKTVTYQVQLGSIWDKVDRMRNIAKLLSQKLDLESPQLVDRTVFLSKADLVTEVVDEFPTLQGEMGALYAEKDGEEEPVVEGIREHYRPQSPKEDPPRTETGIATSLADKLDSLLGSFLLGEEPTGTKDPYGLKRKANGVIRTIIERGLEIDLYEIIEESEGLYEFIDKKGNLRSLKRFFTKRLKNIFEGSYGFRYDVAEAVLEIEPGKFYQKYLQAEALQSLRGEPQLEKLVESFTRILNITEGTEKRPFDPSNFEKDQERELWRKYLKKESRIQDLLEEKSYREIILQLLELKDPVDTYFDEVMIMSEDEELRNNRVNFLSNLRELFFSIGDLSKIVLEE